MDKCIDILSYTFTRIGRTKIMISVLKKSPIPKIQNIEKENERNLHIIFRNIQ